VNGRPSAPWRLRERVGANPSPTRRSPSKGRARRRSVALAAGGPGQVARGGDGTARSTSRSISSRTDSDEPLDALFIQGTMRRCPQGRALDLAFSSAPSASRKRRSSPGVDFSDAVAARPRAGVTQPDPCRGRAPSCLRSAPPGSERGPLARRDPSAPPRRRCLRTACPAR
jgi:hypothetical protein